MPTDKPQIRVTVTPAEHAALTRKAASEGLTLAGLLRRGVGLAPLEVGKGRLAQISAEEVGSES